MSEMTANQKLYQRAILGIDPDPRQMSTLERHGLGYYTGGFHDKWTWNRFNVEKLTEDEAIRLYEELDSDRVSG